MSPLKSSLTFWFTCTALAIGVFADPPQKISRGKHASQNQFPYLASLRYIRNGQHLCGASIISQNHLITAAHCLTGATVHNIHAVVGTINRYYHGWIYSIRKIAMHEQYIDKPHHFFDIAVITLEKPLRKGQSWEIIPIASRDYEPGFEATAAGWGETETEAYPEKLSFIQEPLGRMSECVPYYSAYERSLKICFLGRNGKTTCPGDSGGPVVVRNELVGIVSTGYCREGISLFTKVFAFREFIRRETGLQL